METTMGVKHTVKALLEQLPDECTIDEVIEQLYLLEGAAFDEAKLPPLTDAQREEIDRRLEALEREPDPVVPWRAFLRSLERG